MPITCYVTLKRNHIQSHPITCKHTCALSKPSMTILGHSPLCATGMEARVPIVMSRNRMRTCSHQRQSSEATIRGDHQRQSRAIKSGNHVPAI
jgi:hypothetical protein